VVVNAFAIRAFRLKESFSQELSRWKALKFTLKDFKMERRFED
jgi:hypothetical protein